MQAPLTSTPFTANDPDAPNPVQDLRTTLRGMPKLDLHRHLEGSLRLETLTSIALEHGVDLPSYDLEKLRPYVQVTKDYAQDFSAQDFYRFLEKFKLLRRFYKTEQAIERIAYEAVADAALDNLKYLELRFNPVALAREKGFRYSDVMDWVWEAACQAQAEHDIVVRLIVSLSRQETDSAEEVVEAAIQHQDRGVVALDLSGDEVNYPLQPFIPLFQHAREAGLGVIVAVSEGVCGRPLFASGAFDKLAAYAGRPLFPSSQYYQYVMSPGITWPVWLMVGVLGGAFLSSRLSGEARLRWLPDTQWVERFGPSRTVRFALAFGGAMLVQIGAGIAGGCTSGLAISGGAVLAPAAFLFMMGMFAGGIPTAMLWYRGRRVP